MRKEFHMPEICIDTFLLTDVITSSLGGSETPILPINDVDYYANELPEA